MDRYTDITIYCKKDQFAHEAEVLQAFAKTLPDTRTKLIDADMPPRREDLEDCNLFVTLTDDDNALVYDYVLWGLMKDRRTPKIYLFKKSDFMAGSIDHTPEAISRFPLFDYDSDALLKYRLVTLINNGLYAFTDEEKQCVQVADEVVIIAREMPMYTRHPFTLWSEKVLKTLESLVTEDDVIRDLIAVVRDDIDATREFLANLALTTEYFYMFAGRFGQCDGVLRKAYLNLEYGLPDEASRLIPALEKTDTSVIVNGQRIKSYIEDIIERMVSAEDGYNVHSREPYGFTAGYEALFEAGDKLRDKGRHDDALSVYTHTLEAMRWVVWPDPILQKGVEADLLARQAGEAFELGRHAESEAAYARAIEILERLNFNRLPQARDLLCRLYVSEALVMVDQKRYAEAEKPLDKACAYDLSVRGEDSPAYQTLVTVYSAWEDALEESGDPDAAADIAQRRERLTQRAKGALQDTGADFEDKVLAIVNRDDDLSTEGAGVVSRLLKEEFVEAMEAHLPNAKKQANLTACMMEEINRRVGDVMLGTILPEDIQMYERIATYDHDAWERFVAGEKLSPEDDPVYLKIQASGLTGDTLMYRYLCSKWVHIHFPDHAGLTLRTGDEVCGEVMDLLQWNN